MKMKYTVLGLTLGGLLALTGGCSKSEPAPSASEVDKAIKEENASVAKSVDKAAAAVKPIIQQASDTATQAVNTATKVVADTQAKVTETATKVVSDTQAKLADTPTKAGTQAQGLIDQAKTLVSQSNYQGAVDTLKKLSSLKLTPEQQSAVDDLKGQIQKYLADHATSEGTKAIGNLLGK